MKLITQFSDRAALIAYLAQQFPLAAQRNAECSPFKGGRSAALALLQHVAPEHYAATRNNIHGAVTHLSPYLHHGAISLTEVRQYILAHSTQQQASKLLQELAWRDYFQRVYQQLDSAIWDDIEPYKTGRSSYQAMLPDDVLQGETGLVCMDAFIRELYATGYLHNHARLWLAAYIIHHRHVRWQAGAYWFLQHLLDGDLASNNLSWQWVASTFAAKPYTFQRENLARNTDDAFCARCPLYQAGCPFDQSAPSPITLDNTAEATVHTQSEPGNHPGTQATLTQKLIGPFHETSLAPTHTDSHVALTWIHEDSITPTNTALMAHPSVKPIFVFDEQAIEQAGWTLKRLLFIYECLLEISAIQIYKGQPDTILLECLHDSNMEGATVATTATNNRYLQHIIKAIGNLAPVLAYAPEPFIRGERIRDLRRFSRYWRDVEHEVLAGER